jgi:hypothetical protein
MQVNNQMNNTSTAINTWFAISLMILIVLSGSGLLNFSTPLTQAQVNTDASAAPSQIELATSKASKRISDFATANPRAFTQVLQQSFGAKLDAQVALELTQKAALGQLPVARTMVFVPTGLLGGARGAYAAQDGGLILLDEQIRDDSAVLSEVIMHEWAHHLDASLGPVDAAGEEGDIFLRGIRNTAPLGPSELRQLAQAEHGHSTIVFKGQHIAIELFIFEAFGALGEALGDVLAAPFNAAKDLAEDPVGTLAKIGEGVIDIVESTGNTLINTGKDLVNVVTNVAEGNLVGALGSALNVATGPGNLLNETAAHLDEIQPGFGTLGNIALGATPLGPIAAVSMGLADTVNGAKNGGLAGGLKAGLLAGVDIGMSGVGRANRGLRAAGSKSSPSRLAALKKKMPILKNMDNYKLSKATPGEIALGKKLMNPGNETILNTVKKLNKPQVKYPINIGKTLLVRGEDRNSDGVLLGEENNNPVELEVCPEKPSQQLASDVHKELARLGYEELANDQALGYYQEEQAVKYCETKYDNAFDQCKTSPNAVVGDACHAAAANMFNTCLLPTTGGSPKNCLSENLLTKLKAIGTGPHSDACKLDISDSVSACCDTNYDTAMAHCTDKDDRYYRLGQSYDFSCEEKAADKSNVCIKKRYDLIASRPIMVEEISLPNIVVQQYNVEPNDACEADLSDLTSLRQCCDGKYDTAVDQCSDSANEGEAIACEAGAVDIYNQCLQTQLSRHSTGVGHTERAAPPMTSSPSLPTQPSTSSPPSEY